MSVLANAANSAVLDFVKSTKCKPPPLQPIALEGWESILDESTEDLLRDDRLTIGTEVLDFALFMILYEWPSLCGKPPMFLQVIRQAVTRPDTLKELVLKMCPRLTSRHSQLDAGFRYFVGYIWETASRNLDWVVPWLRTIFGPLIEVAVDADDANQPRKLNAKIIENKRKESRSIVRFLKDLKDFQAPEKDVEYYDTSKSYQRKTTLSSPPLPPLDSRELSPLDPAVLVRTRFPSTPTKQSYEPDRGLDGFVVWSLPSPSPLERELRTPEFTKERPYDNEVLWIGSIPVVYSLTEFYTHQEFMPAVQALLLPFQYTPPGQSTRKEKGKSVAGPSNSIKASGVSAEAPPFAQNPFWQNRIPLTPNNRNNSIKPFDERE
ncbi:hypothetical protein DFH08DRAFT_1090430 [Mycena albidolilacea]|uniref:Uncharacterized protein n=1 Tax=Mycena albidolilacea TaxID=1033008 RepID=A0AAD6YWX1_9AGAR|nr:hypothetical protein DFH08DRAFT_1090430 [Mycena albidolilacea]